MAQGIFLIQPDGSLVELTEEPYDSESLLQELLGRYPNLLSGDQPDTAKQRSWLPVKREMGVADGEKVGARWSLDHLFLDQDGIPTLVEVKRATDTRIRREVVGQILEYAANATAYWSMEGIKAELEYIATRNGMDLDMYVREFLGDDIDVVNYWQRVSTNLSDGKVRLVFVADEISGELERIVEFLSRQMSPAEVYALEVKQYFGQGIRCLVPRIVGPGNAKNDRKQWNKGEFLKVLRERGNSNELEVLEQIFSWAESKNLRIAWGSGASDGAFFVMLDVDEAAHYTFTVRTGWTSAYIQVPFARLVKPFDTFRKKRQLADRIQEATGVTLSDDELTRFPSIKLSVLDKPRTHNLLTAFEWYIKECRAANAAQ